MFRKQYQFNNIVETTQLNNDQMPEFLCHCECSKCSPSALSCNTSLQSPYLRNLLQPCRSVPVAGCQQLQNNVFMEVPLFDALVQGDPPDIKAQNFVAKTTRVLGAAHGKAFVILARTVLIQYSSVTDGQTNA